MAVRPDAVDGIYQGDWVRNTTTGERGKVTFADAGDGRCDHESHVRVDDTDRVEIWAHSEVKRIQR